MAWQYWDYGTASATSGIYYNPSIYSDAISLTGESSSTTTFYYTSSTASYTVAREMLVLCPDHWGEPEAAGFTRLLNDETHTGWTVKMVIRGDIKVADPNIEVRSMADFVPLLKRCASREDRELIDKFFEQVPASPPA